MTGSTTSGAKQSRRHDALAYRIKFSTVIGDVPTIGILEPAFSTPNSDSVRHHEPENSNAPPTPKASPRISPRYFRAGIY
jgi:hypothetical protein